MSTNPPEGTPRPPLSLAHLAPDQQRAALAAEFLAEYAEFALRALLAEPASPKQAAALRRRAAVWKAVGLRVPAIPLHRWPDRVLQFLADGTTTRVVGGDYAAMLHLVVVRLGVASDRIPDPKPLRSYTPPR